MPRSGRRTGQVFAILTVCTGNICRSPLAEQLLRARFTEAGIRDIEVASAGLHAVVGAPMEPIPAELSRTYGGDPDNAVGQQLADHHVAAADLVLTMTVAQRDELVRRHPKGAHRTFTIVEFARLMAVLHDEPVGAGPASTAGVATAVGIPVRRSQLVAGAARRRGAVRLGPEDDVVDPMRRERGVHESVAEQLSLITSHVAFGLR
jgi:protein-tyrosine phosphatase